MVAVLDYHQFVSAQQPFLLELDRGAYAEVVAYCHLVGAAEDYGLILPVSLVGGGERVDEAVSAHPFHIGAAAKVQLYAAGQKVATKDGGIAQNPGALGLAHYGGKLLEHHSPINGNEILCKCGTFVHSHWRELGAVPHEHQTAVHSRAHEAYQVIQQIARAEDGGDILHRSIYTYERGLIHNKESASGLVGIEGEVAHALA